MLKMYKWIIPFIVPLLLHLNACNNRPLSDSEEQPEADFEYLHGDPHSFARPEEVVIKHLTLDIKVDFQDKTIDGKASYEINRSPDGNRLILDTRDLEIMKVTAGAEESEATYQLGDEVKGLGQPLAIDLKEGVEVVHVYYQTRPGAEALQWLEPGQTAGGEYPFLFTQSQAILARTWIPIQDGPGIRFTYDARVEVPADLLALMSASNPTSKNEQGVYHFKMEQPIPAYLMALAAGDLAFEPVGERTGVYAEPSMLEKSTYEFGETQKMLESAEDLYGPYRWDRYDILVLPPSFPFGGMENPRLTFVTPTILAGDRSLTTLIAHELAHSWSGNLVTNENWNDFWLNEGFTVYFERRIMEKMYGESYAEMLSQLGLQDLKHTIEELGKDHPDTRLKLDLKERNPDEGLTDIAYEKGSLLLRKIENEAGRDRFDAFLREYFNEHAFETMSTEEFVRYYRDHLIREDSTLARAININAWVYEPGIPDDAPEIHSGRFAAVDNAIQEWMQGADPSALNTGDWSSHEWLHFIRHLPPDMDTRQMAALDTAFGFTSSGNSEIQAAWYLHAIHNNYKPAFDEIRNFLVEVGRRKFLTPLYSALVETEEGRKLAREIYREARPNYHAISRNTMDEVVGWTP